VRFTTIPPEFPYGGSLAFNQAEMHALFAYGQRCAEAGRIWLNAKQALAQAASAQRGGDKSGDRSCPQVQ
jgi:hypothetical protein